MNPFFFYITNNWKTCIISKLAHCAFLGYTILSCVDVIIFQFWLWFRWDCDFRVESFYITFMAIPFYLPVVQTFYCGLRLWTNTNIAICISKWCKNNNNTMLIWLIVRSGKSKQTNTKLASGWISKAVQFATAKKCFCSLYPKRITAELGADSLITISGN